jgi:SAM-dependent methyltransferase
MKNKEAEATRIKAVYQQRREQGADSKYGILKPENWIGVQALERALIRCFVKAGIHDLASVRLLDAGCGRGGTLLRWILWGADPRKCAGVDLVVEHITDARRRLPGEVDLRVGDGGALPFESGAFDVTTQFTVLSSILEDGMQLAVAREMLRVTRPGGVILSYDFWLNPTNPATRGVRIARLRELFPDCEVYIQHITLAPPIARRLAPWSPLLCRGLEGLKLFNSHYLVMIKSAHKP